MLGIVCGRGASRPIQVNKRCEAGAAAAHDEDGRSDQFLFGRATASFSFPISKAWMRQTIPIAHRSTPLGMGFGQSRFSSPNQMFRLLYAAYDLATAIAETIVRDRFEGTQERVLDESEIEDWSVTEVTATDALISTCAQPAS